MKALPLIVLTFLVLFSSSCHKDDLNNELNDLNYDISFPSSNVYTANAPSGGQNIHFKCIATNTSKLNLDKVPVKVDFAHAPNPSSPSTVYHSINTGYIDHNGDDVVTDPMGFDNACCGSGLCCNTCCPGVYTCTITAYDPSQNSKMVTSSSISVQIDATGNYQIL